MENIVYNTVMSNLLISGTKACAVIPRELMSVDPAYQRLETRNHRKIKAMHDNFDHMIMDALLVVPHPEGGTEPSTLKAKGIAAYPERVELSLALYLQDYLVSLGEPKQFNEKGKKIS